MHIGDWTECVLLFYQLDESCVAQHANERKVRTLEEEEEDEVVSSVGGEASSVSADVDDCDLEELASVENLNDDMDDDDDDDDDDAPQSEDSTFSSGIPRVDVGNSEEITNSSIPHNDVDISEHVPTSAPSSGQADEYIGSFSLPGASEEVLTLAPLSGQADGDIGTSSLTDFSDDVPSLAPSGGQADAQSCEEENPADTAGLVSKIDQFADSQGISSVNNTETGKVTSDIVEEFPDTSIDLQHVSGSKLVLRFLFWFTVNLVIYFIYMVFL